MFSVPGVVLAQSLGSLLSGVRREVEEERARARELEMAVQDKEEMVRIVEKKSNALVSHVSSVNVVELH